LQRVKTKQLEKQKDKAEGKTKKNLFDIPELPKKLVAGK
jgi:hypothetical protein